MPSSKPRSLRVHAAIVVVVAVAALLSTGAVLALRSPPNGSDAPITRSETSGRAPATTTETEAARPPDHASADYGPRSVQCPAGALWASTDAPLQATLEEAGVDGLVCIPEGRHRLTETLRPLRGSELIFEPGAILDGSVTITEWEHDGRHWFATGQRQHFEPTGVPCTDNPAACAHEDVFVDGEPLERVLDRSALRSGSFYFDKPADTIYLADDPNGHQVDVTVTETAIDAGGVHDVTVRNATIEKFGKHGIVTSDGWVVADNEIRYVHSHGMRAFGATRAKGNYIHHTGNMGIFAEGDGLVFDGNRLAYNNYLTFDIWHAGATKITDSANTVVRNNWSHHNNGDGWWFDWDNHGMVAENNLFEHNRRTGMFIEASFDAQVVDNTFRENGTSADGSGAGLWLSASRDVEVFDNLFEDNTRTLVFISTDRGVSDRFGTRETTNLYVHHNTFILEEGYIGVAYGKIDVYAPEANNRFADNDYVVPDTSSDWWRWGTPHSDEHEPYDWEQWNAAGQDVGGTITTGP